MTQQVRIDFLVTGNMSSLHKQVQALNAELMAVAGSMTAVDRSMSNIDFQAANGMFSRMLTNSGQFTTQMVTMKSSTDKFSDALSRQQMTMRQAYSESRRYVTGREGLVKKLARQQVMMQNSILMPQGVGPDGSVTGRVITPTGLAQDFSTDMRVANKSWEVFNATAQQGATQMVNWGKNTQWAGRQLMVGFTVPLMIAGGLAAKTFKDLDEELVRLQKVYGSGFSFGDDFKKQSEMVREDAMVMVDSMARAYGQAGTETAALMADLAASGFEGDDLMKMTEQTTKLSMLGEIDRESSMKATVSLQSAFGLSTDELADKVLFLNAVENQTSASLNDLVEAIPRAGTVVEGLGGSVEDLALYMVAFREGGISAAEGANALKSGLSSIIAPAPAAIEFLKEVGIDLPKIVKKNAGELTPTLIAFQKELMGLNDLARQQAITKLFGKYQFARMNAFFNNLNAKGSQSRRVVELMNTSLEELGTLADQEVAAKMESVSGQWNQAWVLFLKNISVIGEDILKLGTWLLEKINTIFDFLGGNEWMMTFIKYMAGAAAVIGPVVMLLGLFGNMIGMIAKGLLKVVNLGRVLGSGGGIKKNFDLLTADSFEADHAIDSLTKSMYDQTTAQKVLTQGINELKMAYQGLATSASASAAAAMKSNTSVTGQMTRTSGGTGWQHGTVPMERAHFVPRSMDKLLQTPGMNQMLMDEMGYVPQRNSKGTPQAYDFGTMGWSFASRQANQDASAAMPFFAGGKMGATPEQMKSAVDVDKFIATQSAKLNAVKVDPNLITTWQNDTRASIKATAGIAQERLAAERAFLHAVKKSTELRYGSSYFTNQPTTGHKSNFKGGLKGDMYAADREVVASQPGGLADSWMVADQDKIRKIVVQQEQIIALNDREIAAKKKGAIVNQRYNFMVDSLARSIGASATEISTKIPVEALGVAMENMTKNVNDNSVKFELMEREGQLYLVAIDKATGQLMGVANQNKEGGFRQIPNAGVTGEPLVDGRGGPVLASRGVPSTQVDIISGLSAQQVEDAEARAAIDKQIRVSRERDAQAQLAMQAQEKRNQEEELAMQKQGLSIVKSEMSVEQKIAALRQAGLIDEQQKLTFSRAGLTAEQMSSLEDFEQLAFEKAQSAAKKTGGLSGMMGKFGSPMGAAVGGAAMMAPMAMSMLAEPGSSLSNMSNYGMMGSMAGMFGGPWAMAAGTAGGFAIGGIIEMLKASKEESDRLAAEAAANWEAEFGSIDISSEIANQLKLGKLDVFVKPEVDISGIGMEIETASMEYSQTVTDTMGDALADLRNMDTEAATNFGRNTFDNLIASGAKASDAIKLVRELLNQTDNQQAFAELNVNLVLTEKDAEAKIRERINNIAKAAMDEQMTYLANMDDLLATDRTRAADDDLGVATPDALVQSNIDAWKDAGVKSSTAYYEALQEGFDTGAISQRRYYGKLLGGSEELVSSMLDPLRKQMGAIFYEGSLGGSAKNELATFGLEGETIDELAESYRGLGTAEKERFAKSSFSESATLSAEQAKALTLLKNSLVAGDTAYTDYLYKVGMGNDEIEGAAQRILDHGNALDITEARAMALARAQELLNRAMREQNLLASFTSVVNKYVPSDTGEVKVNIEKLQRQQDRELESLQESEADKLDALQEAEDKRLEQMEKAADKRERLLEKEANQVERAYDKEIREIERAEEKRQEQFAAEQERAQRREEMRNMEISYDEAVAQGDLFKAAIIRNDIGAISRQRDDENAEERRQKKAQKKINLIEKEKNQKLRALNQQLRAEQRANEKSIEMAQEVSEAKIEAAQEASDAAIEAAEKTAASELKIAEKNNNEILEDQKNNNEKMAKAFKALQNGNFERFKDVLDKMGVAQGNRLNVMMDFASRKFGELPKDAWNAVAGAIRSGDWQLIGQLMTGKINGLSRGELADISRMYNDPAPTPGRYGAGVPLATGGYVSGPGTGTSDSINARLSNGEYVINQRSVAKYGKGAMDAINSGSAPMVPGFAKGGQFGMGASILQGIIGPPLDMIASMVAGAASRSGNQTSTSAVPGDPGKYSGAYFDAQQLKHAATIASVGKSLGASRRDIVTALVTAMTESSLHNYLSATDHDSLGLFQQRPSAGWGTPEQLTDPKYASRKFYQALFSVAERSEMSIGDAAQRVQVSAYPDRYEAYVDEARAVLKGIRFSDKMVKPWSGNYKVGRTFAEHDQQGVDIPMPTGTPLRAVTSGAITNQPYAFGSYGNWYTLDAGDLQFVYAHLSRDKASTGSVNPGQVIGYSGTTGNSTGPHLHFEARTDGTFSSQTDPASLNIPGLRKGGKINYDNVIANLHKGETVLTAPLTKKFEERVAGETSNVYNLDIDIHNPTSDVDVERAVHRALRNKDRQAGTRRVVR